MFRPKRSLWKKTLKWDDIIEINDKTCPEWKREATVEDERDRTRNIVDCAIWIVPKACQRKEHRITPENACDNEEKKLRKYTWSLYWPKWETYFSIKNISSWWILIHSKTPLNKDDQVDITFMLNKRYNFPWKIVWSRWNLYWIQFMIDHDSLDSVKQNGYNLIDLLSSVEVR